ncbi:hypothetical protein BGZ60DRAFT_428059 [Tricladium varicosporioides]|nr:hypothetical protein BGZ60DRAFT_428059 [Hymenoscyphus varicosporioides]
MEDLFGGGIRSKRRIQTAVQPIEPSYQLPPFNPDFLEKYDESGSSEKLSPLSSTSTQNLLTKPWPSRPQALDKGLTGWRWWDSTVDMIMLMLPLPFIILVIAAIIVDGRPVDGDQTTLLDQAIKGATTVFPIFFAASTGRAAVKYATWKLEQGTSLGELEQLMGSRTVASTFTTQIQLRSFNLIGLVLLIVWSLSPVGSQSVLHILSTPQKPHSSISSVSYINTRQQGYAAPAGAFYNIWFSTFSVLFGSSILAPSIVKESPMDSWGNFKVPLFSSVLSAGFPTGEDGWVSLPSNFTPTYSSLFGIPAQGFDIGTTAFNVESTYIELACGNMSVTPQNANGSKSALISTQGPFVSFVDVPVNAPFAIGYKGPDILAIDAASVGDNSPYTVPTTCPDCLRSDLRNRTIDPGVLLFEEYEGLDNISSVSCTPSQQYVESTVSCIKTSGSQNCRVTAQRLSKLPHLPSTITALSFPKAALGISALLPNSTPQFFDVNLIENYIYTPDSIASIISGEASLGMNEGQTPLLSVTPKEFSDRFGQMLNTFVYGSMWNSTPYIIGAPFEGIEYSRIGGNNASFVVAETQDLVAMIQNQTVAFTVPATLITTFRVYKVDYPWLIAFLICTIVMLLAAIIGVYYSRQTIVPDYLGFVSSLAKESPYIRMPDVGVNMDGMDKARLVKDVKVRLGDIAESAETSGQIGRLAFARMQETKPVKKGKLYI